ncbi:MAG: FAD binding domain-containing protein [Candidatus Marinimicrobia bacterium]|jgi:CO/xanthine dehydrogenase FAD-binding subunit|nr:hypothetical protein [Parcubacteria group bacterium]MDP7609816.1 FAD binding domain-containing protein [Candidatus Neomarinimicrobiota bacterium]|tara:strand:+ start:1775 stop:2725 length:951 start_codon:yes stop_codon:yes gene_type:complete
MGYYHTPSSIEDALSIADKYNDNYTFFAGGTDIQIYRKQKLDLNEHIIDLSLINNINTISMKNGTLSLGAMATLDEIFVSKKIQNNFPLIAKSVNSVATPVLRKTATIGGNLLVKNRCTFYNQSKGWRDSIGSCLRDVGDICQVTGGKDDCYARNVSDAATALIALNAKAVLTSLNGVEHRLVKDLYLPCGIKSHNLSKGTILTQIHLSLSPVKWWYKKLRLRKTLDFTSLTVAATVNKTGIVRVCLNGASMSPILIKESLDLLTLELLIKQARKHCKAVDNDLMPLKYRKQMINVFLEECWETISQKDTRTQSSK